MNPLQEILVMLSTAPEDRIAAARAALLGAAAIPNPTAGTVTVDDLVKTYGVHRATVGRKFAAAGIRPVKTVGGRHYYTQTEAIKAMEEI